MAMTAMEAAVNKRNEAENEIAEIMRQSAEAMESAGLIIHECNDPQRVEIINLTRWLWSTRPEPE
jgi:hypothetical protein